MDQPKRPEGMTDEMEREFFDPATTKARSREIIESLGLEWIDWDERLRLDPSLWHGDIEAG
jgi:hypothetical protein